MIRFIVTELEDIQIRLEEAVNRIIPSLISKTNYFVKIEGGARKKAGRLQDELAKQISSNIEFRSTLEDVSSKLVRLARVRDEKEHALSGPRLKLETLSRMIEADEKSALAKRNYMRLLQNEISSPDIEPEDLLESAHFDNSIIGLDFEPFEEYVGGHIDVLKEDFRREQKLYDALMQKISRDNDQHFSLASQVAGGAADIRKIDYVIGTLNEKAQLLRKSLENGLARVKKLEANLSAVSLQIDDTDQAIGQIVFDAFTSSEAISQNALVDVVRDSVFSCIRDALHQQDFIQLRKVFSEYGAVEASIEVATKRRAALLSVTHRLTDTIQTMEMNGFGDCDDSFDDDDTSAFLMDKERFDPENDSKLFHAALKIATDHHAQISRSPLF